MPSRSSGISASTMPPLALILKTNDTRPLLDITTPIDGTVVFRHAVIGEAEEPTSKLYAVADVSKLWLWIDVFERDIRQVRRRPDGDLHRLGHGLGERGADVPRARSPGSGPRWTRRPGPPRCGPSSPTPTACSGPTSSAGHGSGSASCTRPSSSPRRPCSGTRTRTWSSCRRRRASTGRSGFAPCRSAGPTRSR